MSLAYVIYMLGVSNHGQIYTAGIVIIRAGSDWQAYYTGHIIQYDTVLYHWGVMTPCIIGIISIQYVK